MITARILDRWLRQCAEVFADHQAELTELDAAIGDADHGANMARGFGAVPARLDAVEPGDIGALFKSAAMTLISQVGGASGPLYGTFFLQAAQAAGAKAELSPAELAGSFEAGLAGVVRLGKASLGDKTMVDALTPAIEALRRTPEDLPAALAAAAQAAAQGAEATVPLTARKGRASYLGERSAGHKDPGAASTALLFATLAAVA